MLIPQRLYAKMLAGCAFHPFFLRKFRHLRLKNITFRAIFLCYQVYPDEGHLLEGVKNHLFAAVTEFLQECFHDPNALPTEEEDG